MIFKSKTIKDIFLHPLFKIFGSIFVIAIFGAFLVLIFEYHSNQNLNSLSDAIWWVLVTMTTVGYGDRVPITQGGRVVGVLVMFLGVALVSLFTATISSIYIARQIKEGRGLEQIKFKNHIIICGWNFNGEQILNTLIQHSKSLPEIVLINQMSEEAISDILARYSDLKIKFVYGDYSKESVLMRANTQFADTVIILPDTNINTGKKSDERTILTTLSVKAINSKIKVYAHIIDRENLSHIKKAKADEVQVSDAYTGYLLAAHVLEPGVPQTIDRLFSDESSQMLSRIKVSYSDVGKSISEIRDQILKENGSLVLGLGHEIKGVDVTDILGEDYSYLDEFIKRKFEESGKGFGKESRIKINLNPKQDTIVKENDFLILLKPGV